LNSFPSFFPSFSDRRLFYRIIFSNKIDATNIANENKEEEWSISSSGPLSKTSAAASENSAKAEEENRSEIREETGSEIREGTGC
jgi:hypothetical protein